MKPGKIMMKVDDFLTDTRLYKCQNIKCKHNMIHSKRIDKAEFDCIFKLIDLNENGRCMMFEKNENT